MHYKHQFLKLTIEFYYRFVVPSPFSIIVQIFAILKKDFRKNPFGMDELTDLHKHVDCSVVLQRYAIVYMQKNQGCSRMYSKNYIAKRVSMLPRQSTVYGSISVHELLPSQDIASKNSLF